MEIKTKDEIRRLMKEARKRLDRADKQRMDDKITESLQKLKVLQTADIVYCYASLPYEVETIEIMQCLWERNISVALPRVCGKDMDFYVIDSLKDLESGYMGISEPSKDCCGARAFNSVVIVPGLAFDRAGHRIGYGGGFYDRFFEKEPNHVKIGIAYDFQMFTEIPFEKHDDTMDYIVTSNYLWEGGKYNGFD